MGLAAVGVEEVVVRYTGDFVGNVHDVLATIGFDTARGAGEVAAKTMRSAGSVIVFNATVVADSLSLAGLERLAAHEGAHVRQHEVDEDSLPVPPAPFGRWELFGIGKRWLEEFLAERAVLAAGYGPCDWTQPGDLLDLLEDVNLDLIDAICFDRESAADPIVFASKILRVLRDLAVRLAYLAAARLAQDVDLPPADPLVIAEWDDTVASTWDARLELYAQVPLGFWLPNDVDLLLAATELERALLRSLGFEFREGGFWRVATEDAISRRVERAQAMGAGFRPDDSGGSVVSVGPGEGKSLRAPVANPLDGSESLHGVADARVVDFWAVCDVGPADEQRSRISGQVPGCPRGGCCRYPYRMGRL